MNQSDMNITAAAWVVASAIGVLAGSLLSEYIDEKYLHYIVPVPVSS